MNRIVLKCLLSALLLVSARSVLAVDGQVLINQSTVTAAGGFPYRITQPGSYKLSGNLIPPVNKGAIEIATSNVTLDLNGFSVSCSAALPGAPAFVNCVSDGGLALGNISIRNGSITIGATSPTFIFGYFIVGLSLGYSHGATVESIHFDGTGSNYEFNGINPGVSSILRHNTYTGVAFPGSYCPSLVEGNVNNTGGSGRTGTGCVFVNNVGSF